MVKAGLVGILHCQCCEAVSCSAHFVLTIIGGVLNNHISNHIHDFDATISGETPVDMRIRQKYNSIMDLLA
jgi:hypothetical protein